VPSLCRPSVALTTELGGQRAPPSAPRQRFYGGPCRRSGRQSPGAAGCRASGFRTVVRQVSLAILVSLMLRQESKSAREERFARILGECG